MDDTTLMMPNQTQPKTVDWDGFRQYILKTGKIKTKLQLDTLDKFIESKKEGEEILRSVANIKAGGSLDDIPSEYKSKVQEQLRLQGVDLEKLTNKKKNTEAMDGALGLVDVLENNFTKAKGGEYTGIGAKIAGTGKNIAGALNIDKEAAIYNREKAGFTANLKTITGDTGVLTQQDFDRIEGLLPRFTDDPEMAKAFFNDLRQIIASKFGGEKTESKYIQPENKGGLFEALGLGAQKRTLQNIGTAVVTIPQAIQSGIVSKFDPQRAAQMASQDVFGTQTRARKIAENPQEAIKQQTLDSATLIAEAAVAKYGPKVVGKLAEKVGIKVPTTTKIAQKIAPGKSAEVLQKKALKKFSKKTVDGNELLNSFVKYAEKGTKEQVKQRSAYIKFIEKAPEVLGNKKYGGQDLIDLFIKHGAGYTDKGITRTGTEAAIDRAMRLAIREQAKKKGATALIDSIELFAKSGARKKTLSKLFSPFVIGSAIVGTAVGGATYYGMSKLTGKD